MPLTKALGGGLHELRTRLSGARACRVFFFVSPQEKMVLLHAMIKKTRKANSADLGLAKARMAAFIRAF
jgi:phage-related protein